MVVAAYSASRWTGFMSVDSLAKASISAPPIVFVTLSQWPNLRWPPLYLFGEDENQG